MTYDTMDPMTHILVSYCIIYIHFFWWKYLSKTSR